MSLPSDSPHPHVGVAGVGGETYAWVNSQGIAVLSMTQQGDSANFTTDNVVVAEFSAAATKPASGLIVTAFQLDQNFPNPFNPATQIGFSLPVGGQVSLKVCNFVGQEVAKLVNGFREAGWQHVTFDASHLSSGTYLYRLIVNGAVLNRSMVLQK